MSDETAKKLRGIFVQDSIGAELQALAMPFAGQNQPLLDVRAALAQAAMQRIDWLIELRNHLNNFPESGRVTVGGPR
jgi:hypothetical protein